METANIQSVVENNIVSVALMNIQPSSYNPRKHFDEVSLAELAESIRQQGVLQPIGVRPIADTDRFEIVFGERRYRAALMAELTEISAVILHVSDETAAEMAVTENLQRKDVTPVPYRQLGKQHSAQRHVRTCFRRYHTLQWRCGTMERRVCRRHSKQGGSHYPRKRTGMDWPGLSA